MSLQNPDRREREWMSAITRIGCIACYVMGYPGTPGVVHHILIGGRRVSHLYTICLCQPGHHADAPPDSGKISRHPFKAQFIEAYGTESFLLAKTKEILKWKK